MPEQTLPTARTNTILGLDPEVTPLLSLGLGLTGLTLSLRPRFATVPLALTLLTATFYRDPERVTPAEPDTLFAHADGTILGIDEVYEHRFIHSDCLRISVVIGVLDVPVCRSPAAGLVRMVEHHPGGYLAVNDPAASERNERIYIGMQADWGPLLLTLIAGPLGRRLVCRVREGERLEPGTRIGTARFGARADLYLQRDVARISGITGQRLVAGASRLAQVTTL